MIQQIKQSAARNRSRSHRTYRTLAQVPPQRLCKRIDDINLRFELTPLRDKVKFEVSGKSIMILGTMSATNLLEIRFDDPNGQPWRPILSGQKRHGYFKCLYISHADFPAVFQNMVISSETTEGLSVA